MGGPGTRAWHNHPAGPGHIGIVAASVAQTELFVLGREATEHESAKSKRDGFRVLTLWYANGGRPFLILL